MADKKLKDSFPTRVSFEIPEDLGKQLKKHLQWGEQSELCRVLLEKFLSELDAFGGGAPVIVVLAKAGKFKYDFTAAAQSLKKEVFQDGSE